MTKQNDHSTPVQHAIQCRGLETRADTDSEHSTTRDCAEFWPSPIAWARLHEADVPADSIDLWPTPMGWAAAVEPSR